ncbi:MAG: FHA domain-containing protein [Chloroflexi bacterium]|jgi:hypothetical protein|nr:FHA domain-containing protein [Chloroflexota bacterium]
MFKLVSRFTLLGLILALIPVGAIAQSAARAILHPLNTNAFPEISTYLQAYDSGGNFVHDLTPESVTIIEDDKDLPISEIRQLTPGAQFVVAINMGPAYAIQGAEGLTRYEDIRQALGAWIDTYPIDQKNDDLSIITNDDFSGLHYNRPVAWLSKMREYEPNYDNAVPSLDLLGSAISIAAEPSQPGTGRGILLITPIPGEDSLAALPSLAALAKQSEIRVYIWMISSRAYFDSNGAQRLAQFAQQTGGRLFAYSGEEPLPSIDPYIEPLRYAYNLRYQSQISEGATHQVSARISNNFINATSEGVSFELSIQPPNPIFISPPLEIQRTEQNAPERNPNESPQFAPLSQTVEILVEFPDGHLRNLQRTSLYVDGEVVAENTAPPFDRFTWDLTSYTENTAPLIWVEAIDELGLRGNSIEHQVSILNNLVPFSLFTLIRQNMPLAMGISAALVLSMAAFLLILRGNLRPKAMGRLILRKRAVPPLEPGPAQVEATPPADLPVEEAARPRPSRRRVAQWVNRINWPKRGDSAPAPDYLELDEENRIPLLQRELTFGSDPQQASIVFDDDSVDALHARLVRSADQRFYLSDESSIAGTWLNFQPLTTEGAPLQHGDTILIGRVQFQYKISNIQEIPKPKVTLQETL